MASSAWASAADSATRTKRIRSHEPVGHTAGVEAVEPLGDGRDDAGDVPALAPHEAHQGWPPEPCSEAGSRRAAHSGRVRARTSGERAPAMTLDVEQQIEVKLGAPATGEVEGVVGQAGPGEATRPVAGAAQAGRPRRPPGARG